MTQIFVPLIKDIILLKKKEHNNLSFLFYLPNKSIIIYDTNFVPEDCSITLENSQEYKLHQSKRIHQLVMLENRNKLKVFFFFEYY